jgi:sugar phosphate permease
MPANRAIRRSHHFQFPDNIMSVIQHDPAFLRARRFSLGAVKFCYLFYYTGRQTFGFAIPGIQAELGLQKQTLGLSSFARVCIRIIVARATSEGRASARL